MPIISLKTGTKSRSLLVGNPYFVPSSYESIASATGTGSNSTITFSSFPSTYTALQLRLMVKSTDTSTPVTQMRIRFNSDTGSNYSYHRLITDGSSVSAYGAASQSAVIIDGVAITSISPINSSNFSASIIDIQDYASTTKNKTIRAFSGSDRNGVQVDTVIALNSSVWLNTNAITSIDVLINGGNFASNSVVALYGIKGA
jgi:hypothetical protein